MLIYATNLVEMSVKSCGHVYLLRGTNIDNLYKFMQQIWWYKRSTEGPISNNDK